MFEGIVKALSSDDIRLPRYRKNKPYKFVRSETVPHFFCPGIRDARKLLKGRINNPAAMQFITDLAPELKKTKVREVRVSVMTHLPRGKYTPKREY